MQKRVHTCAGMWEQSYRSVTCLKEVSPHLQDYEEKNKTKKQQQGTMLKETDWVGK